MAEAHLLHYKTDEAREVLRDVAANGKVLAVFGAEQAIKRWEEGNWSLDSMSTSKPFPGFEHLYELDGPYDDGKTFYALLDVTEVDDIPLIRAEWVPDQPLVLKWSLGPAIPSDIASGGPSWIIYISDKTRQLLKEHKLTGSSTYPIALYDKAGNLCEGYSGLSITGRCGPIVEERGALIPGQDPNDTSIQFLRCRGLYFDESTWEGSDFFCCSDRSTNIFATEAVKRVFEENRIRGIGFTPLTDATYYRDNDNYVPDEVEVHFLDNPYLTRDDFYLLEKYRAQELDPAGFVLFPPFPKKSLGYTVDYPWVRFNPEVDRRMSLLVRYV